MAVTASPGRSIMPHPMATEQRNTCVGGLHPTRYDFSSIDAGLPLSEDGLGWLETYGNGTGNMNERRKRRDRRVNPPRQGLPPYYSRGMRDRRQNHAEAARSHADDIRREYTTLDMFRDYTHPGLKST